MSKYVSRPIKRREDPKLFTGYGEYVDDIKIPGMLYGKILRSPYSHARIRSINVSPTRKLSGVVTTLTGKDAIKLAKPWGSSLPGTFADQFCLAIDKVLHVGDEVLAVAATDLGIAEDAVELVDVDYEPLTPIIDSEKAMSDHSPLVHDDLPDHVTDSKGNAYFHHVLRTGDVEEAFKNASHVFEERFVIGRPTATPIETACTISRFNPADSTLTTWCQTQNPHIHRKELSAVLNIAESRIRVIVPDVGGSFGVRSELQAHDVICCLLSMVIGKPVKVTLDRREEFSATRQRHSQIRYPRVAVASDGRILAWKETVIQDDGAAAGIGPPGLIKSLTHLPGPYKIPNIQVDGYCVYTNKCPGGSVRGFLEVQIAFTREVMIDIVAGKMSLDPVEIREKNMVQSNELPYHSSTGMVFDTGSFTECMRVATGLIGWRDIKSRRERGVGVGIANQTKHTSTRIGDTDFESVSLRIEPSGSAIVFGSCSPSGQGHATILAQICAEELGISIDDVRVVYGDTETCPYGLGTYGTRTAAITGMALYRALDKVKEKMVSIAAHKLRLGAGELEYRPGAVYKKDSDNPLMKLREIVDVAYNHPRDLPDDIEPGLSVQATFESGSQPADVNGCGNLSPSYSNATHAAKVMVDVETGQVHILYYVVVHDCGSAINPILTEGQIHGGIAHGLGTALFEGVLYGENGEILNPTFMDYIIPTALDIPPLQIHRIETRSTAIPSGVKGAAHDGMIAVPAAIANAILDALGRAVTEIPITTEKLARLVKPIL